MRTETLGESGSKSDLTNKPPIGCGDMSSEECPCVDMNDDVNPNPQSCTVCTGDTANNIFFVNGRCKLDQMTYEQVYFLLQRVPRAKADLMRVTNDPTLLSLAREARPSNQDQLDDQRAQKIINGNTLPMYNVFKGNPNGNVT